MFGSSRLFISYRRSDAESIARSLFEAFKARLGADRVFFDTASIPFGEDFRRVVGERIAQSAAVLVVIGPSWASVRNERGLRLWQEDDPVRFELLTALQSGRRIVPLRVGGAAAPPEDALPPELRALPFLNMPQLHAESFDSDVNAIYRQLVGEPDELTLRARLKA
ncbi:MAG: toll/interleukin-1 receptor domain-containing protein, partial [Caldimonas sp.]